MAEFNVAPIDWKNFEEVTAFLEDFTEKSKDKNQLRDANDALAQLLGIGDNVKFQELNSDQQNNFLQSVINDRAQYGLTAPEVAQKLLEGLQLRTPKIAPATPAPAFGIAPVFAPGLAPGGGSRPAWPPQQQWQGPPPEWGQQPPSWPPQQQAWPPQSPPPQWPGPPPAAAALPVQPTPVAEPKPLERSPIDGEYWEVSKDDKNKKTD